MLSRDKSCSFSIDKLGLLRQQWCSFSINIKLTHKKRIHCKESNTKKLCVYLLLIAHIFRNTTYINNCYQMATPHGWRIPSLKNLFQQTYRTHTAESKLNWNSSSGDKHSLESLVVAFFLWHPSEWFYSRIFFSFHFAMTHFNHSHFTHRLWPLWTLGLCQLGQFSHPSMDDTQIYLRCFVPLNSPFWPLRFPWISDCSYRMEPLLTKLPSFGISSHCESGRWALTSNGGSKPQSALLSLIYIYFMILFLCVFEWPWCVSDVLIYFVISAETPWGDAAH